MGAIKFLPGVDPIRPTGGGVGGGGSKERGLKNEQELEEFCACKLLKLGELLGRG